MVKAIEGLRSGQTRPARHRSSRATSAINLAQIELDDACNHIIAKRQPAAGDLRLVLTVIKIASDLERIGDEAKKIAKAARRLHGAEAPFVPRVGLSQAVRARARAAAHRRSTPSPA